MLSETICFVKSICYNTPVMEFDPFIRRSPETIPDSDQEIAEKLEKEALGRKKSEKTAKIRKLAISQALDPAVRRREKIPDISAQRHPEAFKLEPMSAIDKKTLSTQEHRSSNIDLQRLTTPELLQVAGRILIEGKDVRTLYESNQIDYRGLHAIVREALRGGNTQAVLEKHHLGEEAQRGRKIEMRHDNPSTTPHVITDYDYPSEKVSNLIDQVKAHEHRPLIKSENDINDTSDQQSVAEESHQKARKAIKKKRLFTVIISVGSGIAIGASLALFIFK